MDWHTAEFHGVTCTIETIDAGAADLWKQQHRTDFLSREGRELAESLGYDATLLKATDREEFLI